MMNLFKERLKELRTEKGLLQQDLARALNVSKSAVSGWEVGRNQPNYDVLLQLSNIFEVTTDYLLGKKDY